MQSRTIICAGLLLLCLAAAQAQGPQWDIVQEGFSEYLGGISCTSTSECWMAGDDLTSKNALWHSSDRAATWEEQNIKRDSLFLMCVYMKNTTEGVGAGIGLTDLGEGSAYTNDGKNWYQSRGDTYTDSQDCGPAGASYVKVGSWSNRFAVAGDGVSISDDRGVTYSHYDWNQPTSSRYASFVTRDLGYVVGGSWPEDTAAVAYARRELNLQPHEKVKFLSRHLAKGPSGRVVWVPSSAYGATASDTNADLWYAAIAKTTDGGKSFVNQLDNHGTSGYYFNGVVCANASACYATLEGVHSDGQSFAGVLRTVDGGNLWKLIFSVDNASFIDVRVVGSNVWIFGGVVPAGNSNPDAAIYKSTNYGSTFNLEYTYTRAYILRGDMVDSTHGYAVGVSGRSNLGAVWRYD